MSFLDLYQGDQAEALKMRPNEGHDLPATFGDTFGAAWSNGQLFTNSNAHENARMGALQDYVDDVRTKTGVNIGERMDWIDSAPGVGPFPNASAALLDQANSAVGKLKEKSPTFDIAPIDDNELDQRAIAKSRQALRDAALMDQREKTFGGKVGSLAGGFASSTTDPINILALPLAPETESVGILGAALRWAGVAGGAQAVSEAAGAAYHEDVQPGYLQSGQPIANVAEAAAGGAVLGGGTRALGNIWTRVKTGAWPTSVKDAGNLIESEANIANTNPLKGAEGEVAHRQALTDAIDSTLKGDPINVDNAITSKMASGQTSTSLVEGIDYGSGTIIDRLGEIQTDGIVGFNALNGEVRLRNGQEVPVSQGAGVIWGPNGIQIDPKIVTAFKQGNEWVETHGAGAKPFHAESPFPTAETPPTPNADALHSTLNSPEHEQALRADIDRERMIQDRQIPVDVNGNGEPVYRSLDAMTDEVDAYKTAADHIAACASGGAEEPANG